MNPSIVSAIIGGCVSLFGIWLTNYLAIRRELLFRGVQPQQNVPRQVRPPELPANASVAGARKTILRGWYRALFGIAICPLVTAAITAIGGLKYIGIGPSFKDVMYNVVDFVPWLYASWILILFPLLVLYYRRIPLQPARLIFAVLTSSILSVLFVLVKGAIDSESGYQIGSFSAKDEAVVTILALFAGSVSGVMYWLITYGSFPHKKASHAVI